MVPHKPREVGFLIAGGVYHACAKPTLASEQKKSLKAASIATNVFWREVTCLAVFSGEWAVFRQLGANRPLAEEVREGYYDGVRHFTAQSREYAEALGDYRERRLAYADAATKLITQEPGTIGNPIIDAFTNFLEKSAGSISENQKRNERLGYIYVLASMTAIPVFDSHFEVATMLLKQNRLMASFAG